MPATLDAAGQKMRLLGLAFAGADLLFEIDPTGVVTFALGAVEQLTGHSPPAFLGTHWTDLVASEDGDMLTVLLEGLQPGERHGPLAVSLRNRKPGRLQRQASISLFRLPTGGDHVSCALSMGRSAASEKPPLRPDGLLEAESFDAVATRLMSEAELAGLPVRLDLIELDGFAAAVSAMDVDAADRTRRQVAAVLRAGSFAGSGASEVATDRFALVRPAAASPERLSESLEKASHIAPRTAQLPLEAASTAQNLKAMRYALDRYIEAGPTAASDGFKLSVERTVRETARCRAILADGAFELAYQPVVDLTDEKVHHFEALARFEAGGSPADTIRLAEELDLISDFDLAVLKCAIQALTKADANTRVAVNLSAVSLMRTRFINALLETTSASKLGPRLLFELTETQALSDLPAANRALQALRKNGHPVCLDDFGAGAASLDYLRHLEFDFVKIDGRYVQAAESQRADVTILRHVVALCEDLGVRTIAEMVETPETSSLIKKLGVGFGQGWLYGKPAPALPAPAARGFTRPARRAGVVEQWG